MALRSTGAERREVPVLRYEDVRLGTKVVLVDDDVPGELLGPIRAGHPGVIVSDDPNRVLVDWYGFEGSSQSRV